MQHLSITMERARELAKDGEALDEVRRACNCKVTLEKDHSLEIEGDAFAEFTAKNVLYAFGRGFEMSTALLLAKDGYYFNLIDLEMKFGSKKRIEQMKARVIGTGGKTKRYIENVTGAHMAVYGSTVGLIGNIDEVNEAETAVNALLEGATHRVAYMRMEAAHRKNKIASQAAPV